MNPPSFWAHNGALYMSMKEIAALKWCSSSQSSKKLKGKVLKACDVDLLLSGGGQAPKYVHTDDVEESPSMMFPSGVTAFLMLSRVLLQSFGSM